MRLLGALRACVLATNVAGPNYLGLKHSYPVMRLDAVPPAGKCCNKVESKPILGPIKHSKETEK